MHLKSGNSSKSASFPVVWHCETDQVCHSFLVFIHYSLVLSPFLYMHAIYIYIYKYPQEVITNVLVDYLPLRLHHRSTTTSNSKDTCMNAKATHQMIYAR